MAHLEKYTRIAVGHLFEHYERSSNSSNYKIDKTKTKLNYNLATHQKLPQFEFLEKRIGEVKCQNRADVNLMCSWVLTAPADLDKENIEDFFKHTYNFMENRYGKKNVISSYVHLDETTPHMHFSFIPVATVKDKKDETKEISKVSAKLVCSRNELKKFHTEWNDYLYQKFEKTINVINGVTKNGNQTIAEMKKLDAKIEKYIENTKIELNTKPLTFTSKDVRVNKKELQALENNVKLSNLRILELEALEGKLKARESKLTERESKLSSKESSIVRKKDITDAYINAKADKLYQQKHSEFEKNKAIAEKQLEDNSKLNDELLLREELIRKREQSIEDEIDAKVNSRVAENEKLLSGLADFFGTKENVIDEIKNLFQILALVFYKILEIDKDLFEKIKSDVNTNKHLEQIFEDVEQDLEEDNEDEWER